MKNNYCIDCVKEVSRKDTKRCPRCFGLWETGKNHYKYNPNIHRQYHCKDCNKEIGYRSALYGQGRCCSCRNKVRWKDKKFKDKVSKKISYALIGEKSSSYIHGKGYEPYTSVFNNRLKLKIRTRDNFECQNCNMTEEAHIIVCGRVLDVHHIDYDKENCDKTNLITLCKQCNLRANQNRDYWYAYFMYIIKENYEQKIF